MGFWGDRLLPRLVDRALRTPEVNARRAQTLAGLSGRVLEVGFGSGLNLRYYPEAVERVLAVEPSDLAWRLAEPRMEEGPPPVERVGLDGARLPVPDASVDGVASTFTLCTIPDVTTALVEIRRVLRPGGRLHFLEHGQAPEEAVRRWQARLQPLQSRMIGYSVVDSPAGLAAWIVEKFRTWSDSAGGPPERALDRDRMLDDITLYWLTGTGASAARLYWESIPEVQEIFTSGTGDSVSVPVGGSIFAHENPRPSRRWAARRFVDIR